MRTQQLTWIPAISSLVVLFAYVSLAFHVRIGLGHWPKPMFENYDTNFYYAHGWLFLGLGFFALFLAAPLWLVGLKFPIFRTPKQTRFIQLGLFGLGWVLFYLYVTIDPGSFTEWFLG
ncbi:MAG: hypothetical protein ACR2RV_13145 [Verrucomicrobiales bacterium]